MKNAFITLAEVSEKWTGVPAGNDQLVHRRDVLVRIDEQPFPVERDDLDIERGRVGNQFFCPDRVHGTPPRRHRRAAVIVSSGIAPDDHFELAGIRPIRQIAGLRVGRAIPPGEAERGDDRRASTIASMIASESSRIVISDRPTGPWAFEDRRLARGQPEAVLQDHRQRGPDERQHAVHFRRVASFRGWPGMAVSPSCRSKQGTANSKVAMPFEQHAALKMQFPEQRRRETWARRA